VVVDSPAPAAFLSRVLEDLHRAPPSQGHELPFSRREQRPAPAAPPAGVMAQAFYTPGVFGDVQAQAMRTTYQGQAALALLSITPVGLNLLI